jgi:hypothetical protein
MNYDYRNWAKDCSKKSAHELLVMAQDLLYLGVQGHYRSSVLLPELESALRKAVIREASVGEIIIEQHEGYMSPDPMFTVGTKSKLKAGTFYIVPKETL